METDEILEYLRDNKIYGVTRDEVQYLINFFDTDDDGKFSYSE